MPCTCPATLRHCGMIAGGPIHFLSCPEHDVETCVGCVDEGVFDKIAAWEKRVQARRRQRQPRLRVL